MVKVISKRVSRYLVRDQEEHDAERGSSVGEPRRFVLWGGKTPKALEFQNDTKDPRELKKCSTKR